MEIPETYVSYTIAQYLKKINFDLPCGQKYILRDDMEYGVSEILKEDGDILLIQERAHGMYRIIVKNWNVCVDANFKLVPSKEYSAPTLDRLVTYLRIKHGVKIVPDSHGINPDLEGPNKFTDWKCKVVWLGLNRSHVTNPYPTCEKALDAALFIAVQAIHANLVETGTL